MTVEPRRLARDPLPKIAPRPGLRGPAPLAVADSVSHSDSQSELEIFFKFSS